MQNESKVWKSKYRMWAAQFVQKSEWNQTQLLWNKLPWWLFSTLAFFQQPVLGRHVCVSAAGRCCGRPTEGVEVLAVLEPRCQSPRPPSISQNMTFMLDWSFTHIVTHTVEKRTERSAKSEWESADLQLDLARAAACCVWRRIWHICQLGPLELKISS